MLSLIPGRWQRAKTNTVNTCVLVKNFSIQIGNLKLEYLLRSCDPTLIMQWCLICDSLTVLMMRAFFFPYTMY